MLRSHRPNHTYLVRKPAVNKTLCKEVLFILISVLTSHSVLLVFQELCNTGPLSHVLITTLYLGPMVWCVHLSSRVSLGLFWNISKPGRETTYLKKIIKGVSCDEDTLPNALVWVSVPKPVNVIRRLQRHCIWTTFPAYVAFGTCVVTRTQACKCARPIP